TLPNSESVSLSAPSRQSLSITFSQRTGIPLALPTMEMGVRVKMSDVAARAGVSVATVSKVVNGRYGVAKETIDLVNSVIDELGYVGNLSASSLRSHRTNVLGILVASFEPYSAELIKGCAISTRTTEYELLAHAGGETQGWERRSIARMG